MKPVANYAGLSILTCPLCPHLCRPSCYSFPMRITVDIPDDLAQQIVSPGSDLARILLEDFAVESYRAGKLTMEQVRQLLSFATRMQVDAFLQRHQVYDYTVQDLEKDLATLDRLMDSPTQTR